MGAAASAASGHGRSRTLERYGGVRERAAFFPAAGGAQAARGCAALVEADAEARRRRAKEAAEAAAAARGPPPPPLSPRSAARLREALARSAASARLATFSGDAREDRRRQRLRDRRAREPAGWAPPPRDAKPDAEAVERFDREVDHYSALGLDRACSAKEVKQGYRARALELHPDKQAGKSEAEKEEAQRKWSALCEAFDVLVDEATRRAYDDFLDGQECKGAGRFGARAKRPPARDYGGRVRAQPTEVSFEVSLFKCFHGTIEPVRHTRRVFDADGNFMEHTKTYHIAVNAGTLGGERYTYPEAGDESPQLLPGDLVFVLRVRREASDYLYLLADGGGGSPRDIAFDAEPPKRGDAVFACLVWHLDGRHRTVVQGLLPAAAAGERRLVVRVPGGGMPDRRSPSPAPGDLLVRVDISKIAWRPGEVRPPAVTCLQPVRAAFGTAGAGGAVGRAVGEAARGCAPLGIILWFGTFAPSADALAALTEAADAAPALRWRSLCTPLLDGELDALDAAAAVILAADGCDLADELGRDGAEVLHALGRALHRRYWAGAAIGGVGAAACRLLSRGASGVLPVHAGVTRGEVERRCAGYSGSTPSSLGTHDLSPVADGVVLPPGAAVALSPGGAMGPLAGDAALETVRGADVREKLAALSRAAAARMREEVDRAGALTAPERKAALRANALCKRAATLAKRAASLRAKASGSEANAKVAAEAAAAAAAAAKRTAEAEESAVAVMYAKAGRRAGLWAGDFGFH